MFFQQSLDILSGSIASSKPNDFWRVSVNDASFVKIRILSYNGKAIVPGIIPNFLIRDLMQTKKVNVIRLWK